MANRKLASSVPSDTTANAAVEFMMQQSILAFKNAPLVREQDGKVKSDAVSAMAGN